MELSLENVHVLCRTMELSLENVRDSKVTSHVCKQTRGGESKLVRQRG
jgi:hypothetical protein